MRLKYGNKKCEVDGIKFDSRKEAKRWGELLLLQRAGEIADLKRQVKFELVINGFNICTYIADATYKTLSVNREDGLKEIEDYIVEDTKSPMSRKLSTYRLKKKLMKAIFNIDILET